jgi:hypothetical protein
MPYTATETGVSEKFGEDEQTVVRRFQVEPWSARGEFYADMLGGVRLVAGRLFRVFPKRDPNYLWLFARGVDTAPPADDPGEVDLSANGIITRASYKWAEVTVTYKPLDRDIPDNDQDTSNEQQEIDLATIALDFSARNLTLPNDWFVWDTEERSLGSAGFGLPDPPRELVKNTNIGVTKVFPQIQVVVTRHLCARKPHNAIIANLGRINGKAMTLAGDRYPKHTLRFDSARANRKITSRGIKFWELSYTFAVQPMFDKIGPDQFDFVGWNRVYDPVRGFFRFVKGKNDGGKMIYEYDDSENAAKQSINGQDKKGFGLLFHPLAN